MMPVLRVSDATFADLSALKTWFGTKTPGDTIDRLVREAMDELGMERDEEPGEAAPTSGGEAMRFNAAPGLSFTKPLAASVNGNALRSPNWSSILLAMIMEVKKKGLEGKRLVDELNIHTKTVRFEKEGFTFHPHLGISVQGQSAPDAWREVDRLAKKWRIPVSVEFVWRQNPKAQYPGKTGVLSSGNA